MALWDVKFAPSYTPLEMLEAGVFEGKYINAVKGLPASWYKLDTVKKPNEDPDPKVNKFKVKSRQGLSVWRENGWIKRIRQAGSHGTVIISLVEDWGKKMSGRLTVGVLCGAPSRANRRCRCVNENGQAC